jgi:hypothetical protein
VGHKSSIRFIDFFVMDRLLRRKALNFPYFFICHVLDTYMSRKARSLPFATFFTKIFKVFDIPLTGTQVVKAKSVYVYTEWTLQLMSYHQNPQG